MTPAEALDRIAALCDGFQADGHGDAVSITSVRAVLAEVTPEPDYAAVNRSLLRRLKAAQAGGVLDRDQALEVLAKQPGINQMPGAYIEAVLDRLAAAVRPVAGVTLTPEEAALLLDGEHVWPHDAAPVLERLRSARLKAAS